MQVKTLGNAAQNIPTEIPSGFPTANNRPIDSNTIPVLG